MEPRTHKQLRKEVDVRVVEALRGMKHPPEVYLEVVGAGYGAEPGHVATVMVADLTVEVEPKGARPRHEYRVIVEEVY